MTTHFLYATWTDAGTTMTIVVWEKGGEEYITVPPSQVLLPPLTMLLNSFSHIISNSVSVSAGIKNPAKIAIIFFRAIFIRISLDFDLKNQPESYQELSKSSFSFSSCFVSRDLLW